MQIAVIGSGESTNKEVINVAEEVGREIAKAGAVLICGGKLGIMEAACRGAKSEGGLTIGILPKSKEEANPYVDIKIVTGIGHLRNSFVIRSADAIIAISGSLGTLSEIIFSILYEKPIVLVEGVGGVSENLGSLFKIPEVADKLKSSGSKILKAKSAEEAVKIAISLIQ